MNGLFSKIKQSLIVMIIKAVQKYGKHRVRIMGRNYEISDRVFNPKYYYTSKFMAKKLSLKPEDIVLDMGTGSGVQAITAAQTASKVVAVDINPEAVEYALKNVAANQLEDKVSVLEGDLFSPLQKQKIFSVILLTPPYLEGRPASDFDHALFDPEKKLLKRFFSEAHEYLRTDGYIQMLYSSLADHEKALSISAGLGWSHELIAQKETFSETFFIFRLLPDKPH